MCFSAEASLTAAVVLGVTGIVTLKNSLSRSHFFLAAIPLLFTIQQLAEGFVWLHLSHHIGSLELFTAAQRTFLIFAFLIWPVWIPLSFAVVEQVPWRRLLLYINLACGVGLFMLNVAYAFNQVPSVQVVHHSLQYVGQIPAQTWIYPLVILLPCFLTSLKNVWIFGILITFGYLVAAYFYTDAFISVWCFFAALVSLSIYKILKDNQLSLNKEAS